jgi:hypothetical protein
MKIEVTQTTELQNKLLAVAKGYGHDRVGHFIVEGKRFFVKRPERRESLKYWITKGHPLRAFKREVALLRAFGAHNAPVSTIVADAPDCIVTADHGPEVVAEIWTRR